MSDASIAFCANGTEALQLALMAMDIGPGNAAFTSILLILPLQAVHQLLELHQF